MNSWSDAEKRGFLEWNLKRKNGELGTPVIFNNVDRLRDYLDNKKLNKPEKKTMNALDFLKLLKAKKD